jgi:glycosyltransferase involved in cell wall biosynthesis
MTLDRRSAQSSVEMSEVPIKPDAKSANARIASRPFDLELKPRDQALADSAASTFKKLSIIMPVYNEARTLRRILRVVLEAPIPIPFELVVVDDASTDATPMILSLLAEHEPRMKVIRHDRNRGKGAAIRTAIEHLTGDVAIVQDADLEYDPREIPRVIAPILEGRADAVFGSRFAASAQRRVLLFWHSVANRLLTIATNVLNDVNLTDMETCYKAVRTDVLKQIPLKSQRFGIEPELTTRLAQWGLRLYEVPISYHGRTVAEGKKIGWKDAFEAAWCLFKFRFLDRRFTTHDGYYILQSIKRAKGFNRWMLSRFEGFIGERVFEAGCGIGSFTQFLLEKPRLIAADLDPFYIEMIQRRYGHLENVRISKADLADPALPQELAGERLDTIISLNVVEHIEGDDFVLKNFFDILQPGGHAIVLVPAHPRLYTPCDKALGHCRRYTRDELVSKFKGAGFEIADAHKFNRLGVYGWWLNGKLGRADLSPMQMRIYEWLLPMAKLLDWMKIGPGLSLIIVGRKPIADTQTA